MSLPTSIDEAKGMWKQQVGAAKITWGKITEDEWLKLEGHKQKLAGLVQERYALTRYEAERQVRFFFDRLKHALPGKGGVQAQWQARVVEARQLWGKLSEEEILESGGQLHKLAVLVQERYAITRYAAEKQVQNFIDRHKH